MSLRFGIATSDRVDIGTGTTLQSLSKRTILLWVYPTAFTGGAGLWNKTDNANGQNRIAVNDTIGNIRVNRGLLTPTSAINYVTNNQPLRLYAWNCLAVTLFDVGTPKRCAIYIGDLLQPFRECTYGTATEGAGTTFNADTTTAPMIFGNVNVTGGYAAAFTGLIASGMVWNRILTFGELLRQQYAPNPHDFGCIAAFRFGYNAIGVQPDLSGNTNNGTITGAKMAFDPVSVRPRDFWRFVTPPVVIAPTLMPWRLQGQMGGLIAQ